MHTAEIGIINSYDNTEELLRRFPVINPTPVETLMEKKIQNRLLTGFENWNRGTEAWMAWGNILYTPQSLYNVHGVHMTLKEYQMSSALSFKKNEMMMGSFNNMVICGDWTAIHYDICSKDRVTGKSVPGSVMEFVHFQDLDDGRGTTVKEGWAGVRGADYSGLMHFLTDEERTAQNAAIAALEAYEIPNTDDLVKKYPVKYPTPNHSAMAGQIESAILQDFEWWNQGYQAWGTWADTYYDSGLVYHLGQDTMGLTQLKAAVAQTAEKETVKRLYLDSMLISGEWAAIHYRIRTQDVQTGAVIAGDRMQFLRFKQNDTGIKVTECWTK